MGKPEPGVRRLCVAAATGSSGLLASACGSGDAGRLHVTVDPRDGTEMAFASPGVDEVAVVTRLIADLHQSSGVARPIRLAFHVGITRIEGEEFGGEAALRTRALLLDPAILAAVPGNGQELTVIMSEGLYSDLRAEGMPGHGWRRIPAASAWMRSCEASRPGAVGCADEAGRRESSSG